MFEIKFIEKEGDEDTISRNILKRLPKSIRTGTEVRQYYEFLDQNSEDLYFG